MRLFPKLLLRFSLVFALAVTAAGAALSQDAPPAITLSPGDTLNISFFARPDISGTVRVRGDGTIAIHQLGEVAAQGRTEREIEADLRGRTRAVFGSEVSVTVEAASLRPVYVFGDVAAPGAYEFEIAMTPLQAFALAGGDPPPANTDNPAIMLRVESEKERITTARLRLAQVEAEIARLEAEEAEFMRLERPEATAKAADSDVEDPLHAILLDLRRALLAGRTAGNDEERTLALDTARVLDQQLAIINDQVDTQRAAVERAQRLFEQGLTPFDSVQRSLAALSTLRSSSLDAQTEAAINARVAASLTNRNEELVTLRMLDVYRQLLVQSQNADSLRSEIALATGFLERFDVPVPVSAGGEIEEPVRQFTLTRRDETGISRTVPIAADGYLLPGDTLEVTISVPEGDDL
ncbi:MAG: polysaccharide biosynthesis/export family protein [Pseudomonadota bacterium]